MVITFKRTRDTKNTVRFDEVVADGDPTRIGALYIQKHAVAELNADNGGSAVEFIRVEFNADKSINAISPAA